MLPDKAVLVNNPTLGKRVIRLYVANIKHKRVYAEVFYLRIGERHGAAFCGSILAQDVGLQVKLVGCKRPGSSVGCLGYTVEIGIVAGVVAVESKFLACLANGIGSSGVDGVAGVIGYGNGGQFPVTAAKQLLNRAL